MKENWNLSTIIDPQMLTLFLLQKSSRSDDLSPVFSCLPTGLEAAATAATAAELAAAATRAAPEK